MKCYIPFHGTKGHGSVWQSYAAKVNAKYPCYHISTKGNLDRDRERNGMSENEYNKLMGYKYKIECDGCGTYWYRQRVSQNSIKAHENGDYYCTKCGSHKFTITEVQF